MTGQTVTKLKPTRKPEVIFLTPEIATELLEHNTLNRPLSHAHVQRIADQIISGRWRYNGDTIKVASTGDVLDGQHRLWAVIEAKKPIETIVVYGIEKEAFSTIDTLRKPRSGADVLALAGAERYRNYIASALQWLHRWQHNSIDDFKAPKNRVENADIEAAFAENPSMAAAIERAASLRGFVNPSVIGFFYFVLTNRNPDLAERMMATLEEPAGVGINDPFFRLRCYFTADRKRRDPVMTIAIAIKAANAAYRKQPVRALSWRKQGSTPEPFPVLDVGK